MTRGPLVGRRERCTRDDLYEQCSLHITLTTPSSVYEGARPSVSTTRRYSSSVKWCERTTSSPIAWSPGNEAGAAEDARFGMVVSERGLSSPPDVFRWLLPPCRSRRGGSREGSRGPSGSPRACGRG